MVCCVVEAVYEKKKNCKQTTGPKAVQLFYEEFLAAAARNDPELEDEEVWSRIPFQGPRRTSR